jgi:hypothetical protein
VGGETVRHVWSDACDFQAAYAAGARTREEACGAREAEVAAARDIEAGVDSLDVTFPVESWGEEASLRALLQHVIHEYARHAGHADLLREGVDGTVGA